jgi:AcrR family transcriptional regulator
VRTILEAAERVYSVNPAASIEEVAAAAGVARTTVHRRFASREALLDALTEWAKEQFQAAIDAARPESTPPMIALYQVAANVLRVKGSWRFAMGRATPNLAAVARVHADAVTRCDDLFRRAKAAGLLREDVEPEWASRVYRALIDEDCQSGVTDADAQAATIVDTLLRGIGTAAARL